MAPIDRRVATSRRRPLAPTANNHVWTYITSFQG